MTPLYTHCPHCGFPVVLNGVERLIPRYCRQCLTQYTPAAPERRNGRATGRGRTKATGRRVAIRAYFQQQRRPGR